MPCDGLRAVNKSGVPYVLLYGFIGLSYGIIMESTESALYYGTKLR